MPEYLIQYGHSNFVGKFATESESPWTRGQQVVVQSPRGLELGTLLGPARFAAGMDPSSGGTLIREAKTEDDASSLQADQLARQILSTAEQTSFPVTFLDCEVMLDGRGAILHAVPYEHCELDPLLAELSERFTTAVRLMNIAAMPTIPDPKTSCGSDNCGSGGGCSTGGCGTKGGCSTGSCSKGKVKSAEELTNYFADLRTKMESRVPLV